MSINRVQQWATFTRQWWVYDAKWQCPFKSAIVLREYLHGKHKPIYHPHNHCGDIVVVKNSRHIAVEGDYWQRWKYYHDTGYAQGKTETPMFKVHDLDPTKVIWTCVYKSMKGNIQRKYVMSRLMIYPDDELPEKVLQNISDQIPPVMPTPRTLEEYSPEERAQIPRLFKWPDDHTLELLPKGKRPEPEDPRARKK